MNENINVILRRDKFTVAEIDLKAFIDRFMNGEFTDVDFFIFEDYDNRRVVSYDYNGVQKVALKALLMFVSGL